MGIPDTYTMPILDTQILTVEETTDITGGTQDHEHIPSCTQVFFTALLRYKKDKERLGSSISLNGDSSSNNFTCQDIKKAINIKKFTAAEIKKATCNFSERNIVGKGGSGIVYKGVLPSKQIIAVKRPWGKELPTEHKEQYVNEINVLSQINNRNVVNLLGCCFERDVPFIVYEYVPNRTLYDHLHDEQNPCVLTWNHRLRIGSEVAQVLAYLHNTIRVPIIHRDIKSSNILLDDNYMPKVCDFGISRLAPCQDNFNTFIEDAWECGTTHIIGTFGYVDPEYVKSGKLTTKSDVYSFGVVLAELLTRKKAVLKSETECTILNTQFSPKLLKDAHLVEILDEQLVNEESMEQLIKVAHLAGRCLEAKRQDRPTMRQVVRELQDIRGI